MKTYQGIVAAATLIAAGAAYGDTITGVLDATWNELDTGLVASHTLVLPTDAISIDSITIVIAHSFMSDLDITVNGFEEYDLMYDEGGDTDLGDGLGTALGNVRPYEFVPIGTPGAFTDFGVSDPNPAGMYEANAWNTDAFAAGTSFTLEIRDYFEGDAGSIGEWRINYTPTPAPGSLALLGLAGAVAEASPPLTGLHVRREEGVAPWGPFRQRTTGPLRGPVFVCARA